MYAFLKEMIIIAGKMAVDYQNNLSTLDVTHKTLKDMVSEADLAIEAFIIKTIAARYPDHAILGEESGSHRGNTYRWIIDPIDGTTNFLHGLPHYGVSIALEKEGVGILGAVNAPSLNALYMAEKGKGATLNGQPISVSNGSKLIESIVASGFYCITLNKPHNNFENFVNIVPKIRGMRQHDSAVIELCYIASGLIEGYWEMYLNLHDIAAAQIILKEAGGKITDYQGNPLKNEMFPELLATNGHIHSQLSAELKSIN